MERAEGYGQEVVTMLNSTNVIRVLIADEQPVARFGLRHLMSGDPTLDVVGEVDNHADLERSVDETRPDVVLVDPCSVAMNGIETLRFIRSRSPNVIIIIYTAHADRVQIVTALELGVSGYLLKHDSMDSLLHDIRRAHAGNAVLSSAITSTLVEHIHQRANSLEKDTDRSLTSREIEVLVCLAHGMSNRAIAEKLSICEATVKFHVHAIFEKLHASNRTKAVMIAIEQDLVQLGPDLPGRADEMLRGINARL